MLTVFKNSWALFAGMLMLQLGNGLQGTLLGIRGGIEGYSPSEMSWVMSAYFVGFLGGSQAAPEMIRRVGHVRVFAALGSLVSACLILFPAFPNLIFWFALRVLIGFSFSGIYVVAESWLNNSATNETRGKTLSVYMIVQMIGIISAQMVLNFADPGGFLLFIFVSVLVSLSFAPILLSASPVPMFQATKRMKLRKVFEASPTGFVGILLIGSIFSALFGMAAIYGVAKGLSVAEISIFVAAIYVGGMLWQYPVGWLSDRMDRRKLIIAMTLGCGVVILLGSFFTGNFMAIVALFFIIGGVANPLYSLLIAYTNDYLDPDDMAAASGGLIFVNGVGASVGPPVIGWMMKSYGPDSYLVFVSVLMFLISGYALYRTTIRDRSVDVEDMSAYAVVTASTSAMAVVVAQEAAQEAQDEHEEKADQQDSESVNQ